MAPVLGVDHRHQDYYDMKWSSEGRQENLPSNQRRAREILDLARRWVEKTTPSVARQVLDFGCGTGWLSELLAPLGRVTGVDSSAAAIVKAEREYQACRFVCADILDQTAMAALGQFDLVVSSEVLEHIPDRMKPRYVASLERLVRPGGLVILTTPNRLVWNYWWSPGCHCQPVEDWCAPAQVREILSRSFEQLSMHTFDITFTFRGRYRMLNSVKVNWVARRVGLARWFERFKASKYGLYIAAAFHRR
jgi:2-polyprenyl-3-methyl-5-hydroxy-6-metoxy-1,4-benzoquinol methylase